MPVQLFGNVNNLQGGGIGLQGGYNPMQTGNPQQPFNPVAPVAPKPVAQPRPAAPRVSAPRVVAPVIPTAQPVQINPLYSQYVQTRPSQANPGVLEYYNPANNMGFANPNDVYNYIRTMTGQSVNDLRQLEGGYGTSQMQANPNQSFAQLAAQAGLSLDDYIKYAGGGISSADRDSINSELGITDLYKQLYQPAPSTQELYNKAYKSAGLDSLKSKIDAKLKEINQAQGEYTKSKGRVDENPWLSEASRIGRNRTLNEQAELRIGNLNNELKSIENLYNNGVSEVNSVVARTTQDFTNNQQINTFKLQLLQQQAEQRLSDLQSSKQASAYQYLPDYLAAKARANKPDTFGSSETGYYTWNPNTGTFEQVISPQIDPYKQLQMEKLQQEINNPNAGKPATDAQNSAAAFALRVNQANSILKNLESSIQSYNKVGFETQIRLPSNLQSSTIQSYNQAARGFINALLRRESGAAIADSEFDRYVKQYIPQPGDSPQVLVQKAADRNAALQGLINSAGSAYGNLTGGGANPSDPLGIRFNQAGNASASTPYLKTLGQVTGLNGSALWSNGLDVDLKVGDPVKAPVSGMVIAAAPNGGFGNQVKIKTVDGKEIWLSHLDSGTVKVGQLVQPGQLIGYGGKTGKVIAGIGGDGSHLDITIKDANGRLLSAPQVKQYLDTKYV